MPIRVLPAIVLLCLSTIGCGGADPDERMPDWEEHFNRANQLTRDGRHDEAIAVGDGYLKRYPDNSDGHLMVAAAALAAAQAASDASRQSHFERAATHYAKVVELSKNRIFRTLAIVGAIEAYGPRGLNRPADAERQARVLVAEDPTDSMNYNALVVVLKDAKKFPELGTVFTEMRAKTLRDAAAVTNYGGMIHDLVAFTSEFPRDAGRTLLADAAADVEQALGQHGRTEGLLRTKGMLLRAQADIDPDPARQRALSEQSDAAFAELDRLTK